MSKEEQLLLQDVLKQGLISMVGLKNQEFQPMDDGDVGAKRGWTRRVQRLRGILGTAGGCQ